MVLNNKIIALVCICGVFSLPSHAQDSLAGATPETVYSALSAKFDNLVGQNAALNDSYAKLLACSKLKMFYAPDDATADGQGCVAAAGGGSLAAGGTWAQIDCPGSSHALTGNETDLFRLKSIPACPSEDMAGKACGDIGQKCKISSSPMKRCHLGEHENTAVINGFVCR